MKGFQTFTVGGAQIIALQRVEKRRDKVMIAYFTV